LSCSLCFQAWLLGDMASRIQVMAQVYDHLTIRAELKVADAKQYLTEICQYLSASISGMSPVAITARADELYIHSEQAPNRNHPQ
jgi:two-component sensor histidine kinase